MRYAIAVATLLAIGGLGLNRAAAQYYCQPRPQPNPHMNFHPAIYVNPSAYWHPCGYGIWGPTDSPCQPVNGLGVPPYCPRINCGAEQGPAWHRYIRSPRDFWMLQY
jgi:hypothetical protein